MNLLKRAINPSELTRALPLFQPVNKHSPLQIPISQLIAKNPAPLLNQKYTSRSMCAISGGHGLFRALAYTRRVTLSVLFRWSVPNFRGKQFPVLANFKFTHVQENYFFIFPKNTA